MKPPFCDGGDSSRRPEEIMPESISRVLSRIREIQALLGERPSSNEAFGKELSRRADEGGPAVPKSGLAAADVPGPGRGAHAQLPSSLTPIVEEAAARTGLPQALISAVMESESGHQPDA